MKTFTMSLLSVVVLLAAAEAKAAYPSKGSPVSTQQLVTQMRPQAGRLVRVANADNRPDTFGMDTEDRNGNGILLTMVDRIGPAQRAGFQVGDIITSMNGRRITRGEDWDSTIHLIRQRTAGDMQVRVIRGGREITLSFNANRNAALAGVVRT